MEPSETKPELKREIRRLKVHVAMLRKLASDKLGQAVWGLSKDKEEFTHDEIIFLFARIFEAYDFAHISQVRTAFPDCIAVKGNKQVGIEFEPILSSFQDHLNKHDLSKCQYIVCWRDDLELGHQILKEIKKHNIEVIQLKTLYEQLKGKGKKTIVAMTDRDMMRLKKNQLRILKAFITYKKDILTRKEITECTELEKQALGGALSGFTQMAKYKEWLVRLTYKGWEFNSKYRSKVVAVLKDLGI